MAASHTHQPRGLPSLSLEAKVCVVTGAARGLGLEFCRAFIQSGCTSLAILDLRESDCRAAAEELIAYATGELGIHGVKIVGIGCDVADENSVKNAFDLIITNFGRVDVAVASAGIVENYPALEYPADRVRALYDVNVHGVFFTAREAAKRMIPAGGGSIILISSMSANIVNTPQFQTPYNASKAAVKHMAASLGVEWARDGVRVNALSPGYMLTKLTKSILDKDPALKATWESLTPMGRMGDPEDLSGAIVFLASDASKFVTGSEIRVDGDTALLPTTMSTSQHADPQTSTQKPGLNYEFLKRKKWADLVVSDVVNAIFLVLSPAGSILYCGSSITEVLGWRDVELIDRNLLRFFNDDDQQDIAEALERCLQTDKEELIYGHFKTNEPTHKTSPKEVLGELRVYSHVYSGDNGDTKVLVASFTPKPSRTGHSFNSGFDLKYEQWRLKSKIAAVTEKLPAEIAQAIHTDVPSNPIYATSTLDPSGSRAPTQRNEGLGPYVTGGSMTSGTESAEDNIGGQRSPAVVDASTSRSAGDEKQAKKAKRNPAGEKYVCSGCGGIESPEWRKGPNGPKTLCNACGLRWAKNNRKPTDTAEGNASERLSYQASITPPPA